MGCMEPGRISPEAACYCKIAIPRCLSEESSPLVPPGFEDSLFTDLFDRSVGSGGQCFDCRFEILGDENSFSTLPMTTFDTSRDTSKTVFFRQEITINNLSFYPTARYLRGYA